MTLARLESGKQDLETVPIRVGVFLERICADWEKPYAGKSCRIRVVQDEDLPLVEADPMRLEQVFYNLMDNALKYSDRNTEVELGVRYPNKDGWIELYVQDQGIGIPSDRVESIFQRFYRVDRGRSRELGGTGLGLAIVKHIVHQHGGRVWAESELGKGTRITMQLPVRAIPAAEPFIPEEEPQTSERPADTVSV
jgi:two-component system phosphate regulon sensor histidine kinase PhoR